MKLEVENVVWGADGHKVLRGVSLEVAPGEVIGLIGRNGNGKTSLLRCVYKVLRPHAGLISLGEENVLRMGARSMARAQQSCRKRRPAISTLQSGGSWQWAARRTRVSSSVRRRGMGK